MPGIKYRRKNLFALGFKIVRVFFRLRTELTKTVQSHKEQADAERQRHSEELTELDSHMNELKIQIDAYQSELLRNREAHEESRLKWLAEQEEHLNELHRIYDKDKSTWDDERRQLMDDIETLKEQIKIVDMQKASLECQFRQQLENGWETQLPQILQWVHDEKEARVYLQVRNFLFRRFLRSETTFASSLF